MVEMTPQKKTVLGLQHMVAMFGATILVPLITGLNPSVALIAAGVGTWLFHIVTKFGVPVFLGSSFAFIPPILLAQQEGFGFASIGGGIMAAGTFSGVQARFFQLSISPASIRAGQRFSSMFSATINCLSSRI